MYLSIRYHTTFDYPEAVQQSHSELRAAPGTTPVQQPLSYRLTTTPAARTHTYVDYWGTIVEAFGIRSLHDQLEIRVDAVVDTTERAEDVDDTPLADLAGSAWADAAWEMLQPSPHVQLTDELVSFARDCCGDARRATAVVDAVTRAVHERLVYTPGATEIGESTEAVLAKNQGVCQDYAHLMVAACRSLGLPARYVSGYLYARDYGVADIGTDQIGGGTGADRSRSTDGDGDGDGGRGSDGDGDGGTSAGFGSTDIDDEMIQVQTHAWVEVRLPEVGWVARDPTNHLAVGERHVRIGAGRDYGDVAPLRGTYVGHSRAVASAGVEMRRLSEPNLVNPALRQHQQQQQQQQQ